MPASKSPKATARVTPSDLPLKLQPEERRALAGVTTESMAARCKFRGNAVDLLERELLRLAAGVDAGSGDSLSLLKNDTERTKCGFELHRYFDGHAEWRLGQMPQAIMHLRNRARAITRPRLRPRLPKLPPTTADEPMLLEWLEDFKDWIDRAEPKAAAEAPKAESEAPKAEADGFVCDGATWRLTWQGQTRTVRDAKGIRYLAYLFERPNKQVAATDLFRAANKTPGTLRADTEQSENTQRKGQPGDAPYDDGTGLDYEAAKDLYQRQREIEAMPQEKRLAPDVQAEYTENAAKLNRYAWSKGRTVTAEQKRSVDAITKAIRRGLQQITKAGHEAFSEHLDQHVDRGQFFCYRP